MKENGRGEPLIERAVKLAKTAALLVFVAFGLLYLADKGLSHSDRERDRKEKDKQEVGFDAQISDNARRMLEEGRQIFRFDTLVCCLTTA